jgi:hypothetical protein
VQPQTLAVPPPPQVLGRLHVPQFRVPPQPLEIVPQFLSWAAHVVGVQPQVFATPLPPQVWGAWQVSGQDTTAPQPSEI